MKAIHFMEFSVVLWHNLFVYCFSNSAVNVDCIMTLSHCKCILYICCRNFSAYILIIFCCPYVYRSYVTDKASGVCQLLMDGMESMYLTVKNFIVMIANTIQIDSSHIFNILYDIKVKRIITVYLGITLYRADEFHTDMHKLVKGRSLFLDQGLCMLLVEDDTMYSVHIEKYWEEVRSSFCLFHSSVP